MKFKSIHIIPFYLLRSPKLNAAISIIMPIIDSDGSGSTSASNAPGSSGGVLGTPLISCATA